MAASGYTPISLYHSTTAAAVPLAANLVPGELAINTNDGKLYYENSSGVVTLLASSAGASGDVVGPASSTDNAIARFDGTTGKIIQNSAVTIADTTGDITTAGYLITAAGAVGTPAITTTGDTNTGIFFPAADTIAFTEGGTEAMRITSLGQLFVNTTNYPSTTFGNAAGRHLFGGSNYPIVILWNESAAAADNASQISLGAKSGVSATSWAGGTVLGAAVNNTDNAGYLAFLTTNTLGANIQHMRITSTGDVGIGTSSPASKLDVVGGASISGTMGVGDFAAQNSAGLNVRFIGNLATTDIAGVSVSISAPATASNSTNGVYSSLRTTATSGSRGSLSCFYAEQPSIGAGSSVSASNGVFVRNQGNASIAAAYGIRIEPQSGSTINLGLYNESSARFDGNIGLNTLPSGSGTGITFPATQSASSDANTLDDYEEGTWTPSVGGNATYQAGGQSGYYTKIGNFVKLRFFIAINTIGTGSATTITGIPFTPNGNSPIIVGGVVCYAGNLATAALALGVYAQSNGNIYFFTRNTSATTGTTQQPAVIGNSFEAYCEISYMV